jgi:hypothetical protein
MTSLKNFDDVTVRLSIETVQILINFHQGLSAHSLKYAIFVIKFVMKREKNCVAPSSEIASGNGPRLLFVFLQTALAAVP